MLKDHHVVMTVVETTVVAEETIVIENQGETNPSCYYIETLNYLLVEGFFNRINCKFHNSLFLNTHLQVTEK